MEKGRFVLVTGPSGAGKDTLIAGARERLGGDERFVFPERLITRDCLPEAERHGTISRDAFARMTAEGRYALAWEAHGLGYVIPREVAEMVTAGRIAVCNVSRRIVPDALARFAGTHVLYVDADRSVRAGRLAARGRESRQDIEARLARDVPDFPADLPVTRIDNSGTLDMGVTAFVAALAALADQGNSTRRTA